MNNRIPLGAKVECNMEDINGNSPMYGEVIDNNFLGFAYIVRCTELPSEQYSIGSKDAIFTDKLVKEIKDE